MGVNRFGLLAQARLFARMAGRLPRYLRHDPDGEAYIARLSTDLANREPAFLSTFERAIWDNPGSPYRRLLDHAGITLEDVRAHTVRDGLEATLALLHREGVYVSIDEFKGRKPVLRGSLSFETEPHDFDNPLVSAIFETRTGGSRSGGGRLFVDLDLLANDAMRQKLQARMFGLDGRPLFVWCSAPPFQSGMNEMLRCARLGVSPVRWFAQSVPNFSDATRRHAAFTRAVGLVARTSGIRLPQPEYTPLDQAVRIAEALAAAKKIGPAPVFRANASSAVRVCAAALDAGLDISGTFMRVSAEPFTPAKAAVIREAGCTASPWYATGEAGFVGLGCGNSAAPDEVHLMTDKLALIEVMRDVPFAQDLKVLCITSISAATPKLMLNYVSDDFATVANRDCGCLLHEVGFATHATTIRSWEKLTSEGMSFAGNEIMRIIEDVLPSRFGGTSLDYQFVEREVGGLAEVELRASPRLGGIDEAALRDCVLRELDGSDGGRQRWADRWRQAGSLRIVREQPSATAASKVLALHVERKTRAGDAPEPEKIAS